uniref:Putative dysbindin-like protein n=2 Tax=Rhodnius TaxID=13248 RepID=A0A0P4VLC2_9HEMI
MLESFVEKFQYVQDGISSSFRGLTLGEPLKPKEPLNFEAGCAILSKFQDAWEELHSFGEANAQKARDVDLEIGRIYHVFLNEKRNWETFQREFSNLEKMKTEVETVVNILGNVRSMCSDIEEALMKLENLIEIKEYYKSEAQEKIKLSNYRVDKLMNLDAYRELLAEEHSEKVQEIEEAEMAVKQTKQDVYQAKFREEMEAYKRTGELPQAEIPEPSEARNLEDVILEGDAQDLEQYLQF